MSPSMSGEYAVPFIFTYPSLLGGWVPVSPVSLDTHTLEQYKGVKVPTLAVYGEKDAAFRSKVI